MSFYLFGSNTKIAPYPVTIGSFETESEAQKCLLKYKDAGWTALEIEQMDWI